jgi:hypothetical protein
MRAQRIKTGFQRIGTLVMVLTILLALVRIVGGQADDTSITQAFAIAAWGLVLFGLVRAVGWIIAGFAGDGEEN